MAAIKSKCAYPGCPLPPLKGKPLNKMTLKELKAGYKKEGNPYRLWCYETFIIQKQRSKK